MERARWRVRDLPTCINGNRYRNHERGNFNAETCCGNHSREKSFRSGVSASGLHVIGKPNSFLIARHRLSKRMMRLRVTNSIASCRSGDDARQKVGLS